MTDADRSGALTPAELLAREFHRLYEQLAPAFSYETRPESARPWEDVPHKNRMLMIAVCAHILADFLAEEDRQAGE